MFSRLAFLTAFSILGGLAGAQAQDSAAMRFAGVWEGTQRWAIANPPPAATAPQPVTLAITESGGRFTGTLMPFFGGSEGASFIDVRIVGNQLRADGVVGEPRTALAAVQNAGQGNEQPYWKDAVKIAFTFNAPEAGKLMGTADLTLGGVQWLKFQYTLTRREAAPQ